MQSFNRYLPKISIGLAGLALVVLAVIVLTPSPAPAQPVISWVPESVIANVTPGESKTIPVSFTSLEDVTNVTVQVVPELEPYVTTNPTSFTSIAAGQVVNLDVMVSAGQNPSFGVYDGTIQLRTSRNLARPLPVNVTVSVVPVPPDPGEAGKATLEGIDSDGDGVRDDIERYIVLTYPESERTRAALVQFATTVQALLFDAENKEASIAHTPELQRAIECIDHIRPNDSQVISSELQANILNTDTRSRAWIMANAQVSGEVFTISDNFKSSCNFNPDTMEN